MATATLDKPTGADSAGAKTGQKKYKFKLLYSQYVHTEYVEKDDGKGGTITEAVHTTYQADRKKGVFPVIETDVDLTIHNGRSANMKKFERLYGETPVTMVDPTQRAPGETIHAYLTRMTDLGKQMKERVTGMLKSLDTLDLQGLVKVAAEEEIDISAAKTPDEARKIIRDSLKS